MKQITVNSGTFYIDDEDYDRVMEHKWFINTNNYVATWPGQSQPSILLHRFILNYAGEDEIDHIDRDPRNNTKVNLRIVPNWQNALNRDRLDSNTSGATGVHHNKNTGKFEAFIFIDNRKRHLGTFNTFQEAKQERVEFEKTMLSNPELRNSQFPDIRRNNKSGVVGVSFAARMNRWKAKIDQTHLGYFKTLEEAIAARKEAEKQKVGTL